MDLTPITELPGYSDFMLDDDPIARRTWEQLAQDLYDNGQLKTKHDINVLCAICFHSGIIAKKSAEILKDGFIVKDRDKGIAWHPAKIMLENSTSRLNSLTRYFFDE